MTAPALWINQTFSGFDAAVTTAVHKLYEWGGAFFTYFFESVSFLGKGGIFLIALSLILMVLILISMAIMNRFTDDDSGGMIV